MHHLATLSDQRGDDGAWRYALVRNDGARGDARRLDRNLFFLAMVSELRRMGSPYRYAVVWDDAQDTALGEGLLGQGSGFGRGAVGGVGQGIATYQTAAHQAATAYQQPQQQQQQGPGQARTPRGIRQRREEGGRVMYLVGFWEGGPERWMVGEELRGGGGGALVEEWERRFLVEGE
jgi:hypothetical protein